MPTNVHTIHGMHCEACVERLNQAFRAVPGVKSAHVTLVPPEVHIESDAPIASDALERAARGAGEYSLVETAAPSRPSLYPLFLIVAFIAGTAGLTTWFRAATPELHVFMLDFMAGFFLVFSFFKLLDLRGFADAYQSYDLVARRSRAYALLYPFLELALGIAYLVRWNLGITNWVTLVLMLVGSAGVLRALLDKRAIRCACLGTALNLPMTTVTLVEDLGMAAMALAMILY